MTTLFRVIHSLYAFLVFIAMFILLFPFFLVFSLNRRWHFMAYRLDYIWARIYFPLALFRTKVEFKGKKPGKGPVIYCANHFSYLDIPSMGLLPKQACFVGKASIKKTPLFGYMFRSLHIAVNRSSVRDRVRAYKRYAEAIRDGKSLFIYPEGGIVSNEIPVQAHYKDGAFRVAIEENVPIVPITIPYNWRVLPDGIWTLQNNYIKLIVHEPICTNNLTLDDVQILKTKVHSIIQSQIEEENHLTTKEFVQAT